MTILISRLHSSFFTKNPSKTRVFDLLSARLIAGKYSPGEWLRQEESSSQLGVSQTPVREALDLLVSAGLAERVPYRGVRIREFSHDEILDAYILRLQLESLTVRLAALNTTVSAICCSSWQWSSRPTRC